MANKATWALILGIIGIIIPFVGIAALVVGILALKDHEEKGLAIAGIVLGVLSLLWLPLVLIGSIAYFGVLSPTLYLPDRCVIAQGISCMDFMVDADGDVVRMQLMNSMGTDIENVVLTTTGTCADVQELGSLSVGERVEVTIPCSLERDEAVDMDLRFEYQAGGAFPRTLNGELTAMAH